jgi:hypothetical protein
MFVTRSSVCISVYLLVGLGAACGCGRSRHPTVPVTGHVHFDGQPPPALCTLFFIPVGRTNGPHQQAAARPGRARTAADGSFAVSTFGKNDGLIAGEYDITLECWRTPPEGGHEEQAGGVSFVPAGFVPPRLVVPAAAVRAVRYELDVMVPMRR